MFTFANRHAEAVDACRRALDADATLGVVWNGFAWSLYLSGQAHDEAEAAARRAVALEPAPHHAHTLATILIARDKWTEAVPFATRFLTEGSDEWLDDAWPDTVRFFREAVRTGHAADAARLLDDTGRAERWRPLREALYVLATGERLHLRRVAPEVRQPAELLLRELSDAPDDDGPVAPTAGERKRRRSGQARRPRTTRLKR